jgi:hypothetical protein
MPPRDLTKNLVVIDFNAQFKGFIMVCHLLFSH